MRLACLSIWGARCVSSWGVVVVVVVACVWLLLPVAGGVLIFAHIGGYLLVGCYCHFSKYMASLVSCFCTFLLGAMLQRTMLQRAFCTPPSRAFGLGCCGGALGGTSATSGLRRCHRHLRPRRYLRGRRVFLGRFGVTRHGICDVVVRTGELVG